MNKGFLLHASGMQRIARPESPLNKRFLLHASGMQAESPLRNRMNKGFVLHASGMQVCDVQGMAVDGRGLSGASGGLTAVVDCLDGMKRGGGYGRFAAGGDGGVDVG